MDNIEQFKNDFIEGVFDAYDEGNVPYDRTQRDFNSVALTYLNMLNRLIGPKKRTVHISNELNTKLLKTDNESIRIAGLVEDMKTKFETGVDVNGHLSKRVLSKIDEDDKFLDDWNIMHLHLSYGNPDVFDMTRVQSGDLLMIVLTMDDVYFIDVTNHSRDDWFRIEYLKIIKDNWEKELLIKHDEIVGISHNFTSVNDIKTLRNANVNSNIHEIDGKYYSVKNAWGYSMAGTSNKAMFSLHSFIRFIDQFNFEYDKMDFNGYNINCLCRIYDKNGNYNDIIRNIS